MLHVPADKREEWDYMLNAPIPGKKPTHAQAIDEGEAFMASMAILGGT